MSRAVSRSAHSDTPDNTLVHGNMRYIPDIYRTSTAKYACWKSWQECWTFYSTEQKVKALGSSAASPTHLKGAKAILEPCHHVEAAGCVEHDGLLMSFRHVTRLIHKENLSTVLEIILLLWAILMRLMHVLMCFLEPFRYKFWCRIHASCQEWRLSCGWSWLESRTRQRGSVICCIDLMLLNTFIRGLGVSYGRKCVALVSATVAVVN